MSPSHAAVGHLSRKPAHRAKRGRSRRRGPSPIVVAVAVVFVLAAVAALLTVSGDKGTARETAPVEITGTRLPPEAGTPDPAAGMKAPQARGVDFEGHPASITDDGRAKVILFLAHWCPHCQREVPKVVAWLRDTGGVAGVDLYAVSTMAGPTRPNWPPSAWLGREAWSSPVLVDDERSGVAEAFGLSGTPLWVFVRSDGTIVSRISGEVPIDVVESQMRALL